MSDDSAKKLEGMKVLVVIPARAGSKGLPNKNLAILAGRPVIAYTVDDARASKYVNRIVVSTESEAIARVATELGVEVIDRPTEYATDKARLDYVLRHVLDVLAEREGYRPDVVVMLYANVPAREPGIIDRCLEHLVETGADSVRTFSPVGKFHPQWMSEIRGDRIIPHEQLVAYRRQDLKPLFINDGACVVMAYVALADSVNHLDDNFNLFGHDCRGIVSAEGFTVDIDTALDLDHAQAVLRRRGDVSLLPVPVRIGERLIGPGEPVYIIAEAGVNHNGDMSLAHCMIDAAKEAGADAVKFQAFKAGRMVTRDAPKAPYQKKLTGVSSQYEMLKALELTKSDFMELRQHAVEAGIDFVVSPFDIESMTELMEVGLDAIKIGSTQITDSPVLEAAAKSGLPVIMSTGAATLDEIERAVSVFRKAGGKALILMHCVSAYPAPLDELNLAFINVLEQSYHVPVGFSDHSRSENYPVEMFAALAGACVLEKHFTLDRTLSGPDHAMSLDAKELTRYVENVKDVLPKLRGSGQKSVRPVELEVRASSRKSIVAAADITKGEVIASDDLTLKRPGTGLGPEKLNEVIGRVARTDIPTDTLITEDMLLE